MREITLKFTGFDYDEVYAEIDRFIELGYQAILQEYSGDCEYTFTLVKEDYEQ